LGFGIQLTIGPVSIIHISIFQSPNPSKYQNKPSRHFYLTSGVEISALPKTPVLIRSSTESQAYSSKPFSLKGPIELVETYASEVQMISCVFMSLNPS
jgi:hypothetical protein